MVPSYYDYCFTTKDVFEKIGEAKNDKFLKIAFFGETTIKLKRIADFYVFFKYILPKYLYLSFCVHLQVHKIHLQELPYIAIAKMLLNITDNWPDD